MSSQILMVKAAIASYMFLLGASIVQGGPVTTIPAGPGATGSGTVQFYTDYDLWVAAVGAANIRSLDFETLPDGNPGYSGALITPDNNYTDLGVTFSSPRPVLRLTGSPGGLGLVADSYPDIFDHNWLEMAFLPQVYAVGVRIGGGYLSLYDTGDELLGTVGGSDFLGAVSTELIDRAKWDSGSYFSGIGDLYYAPIPEPASLSILALGLCFLVAKATHSKRCK